MSDLDAIDYVGHRSEPDEDPEACPSCDKPPVIIEQTEDGFMSVGCSQAFLRPQTSTSACPDRPAVMVNAKTRGAAIAAWNEWVFSRRAMR